MDTISRKALATRWGRSVGTLANWAAMGRGPQPLKFFDGTVAYRMSEVIDFETHNNMERGE